MYLKIIGSLFLMTSASAIGFLKAEELKERVKCLEELKRMMILLQGELRFRRSALAEAFENVSYRMGPPFREFLSEMSERLLNREEGGFERIWEELSGKLLKREGFRREDGQLLDILRSGLGYLDLTMQTETFQMAILQTEESIKLAKEQQKEKGRLYQTMGVTFGAILTLLII